PGADGHAPGRAAGQERRQDERQQEKKERCQPAHAETPRSVDMWWGSGEPYHKRYGLARRTPGVVDMARPAPGGDQDNIEPADAGLQIGPGREEPFGRPGDAPALAGEKRFRRPAEIRPGLDLDEGQDGAAPGYDVDLPRRCAMAMGDDLITGEPE